MFLIVTLLVVLSLFMGIYLAFFGIIAMHMRHFYQILKANIYILRYLPVLHLHSDYHDYAATLCCSHPFCC
jgi:hypothetical protein